MPPETADDAPRRYPPLMYRPEIDGMRGVAVLVVVLFHAGLGCPGGYVGVDVFFVISGFLITSLILPDLEDSRFSLVRFWERRVRRIVPAVTVTVAAVLAAAWLLYLPADFALLGRAVVAQSVIASNIFYWRVSGYFGPSNDALPLLHTWSLAVEEQFYLVVPLALLALNAWRRSWVPRALALCCLASFALSVGLTPHHATAAFFLLPTRAWELLTGALLAAYPTVGRSSPRWLRETVAWGGLAATGAAVGLFDQETLFPGVAALLPCAGAVGLIWGTRFGRTSAARALAWRPVAFVGQTSYSFYLIHWPALAFGMYWLRDLMGWQWRLAVVVGAFALSVASWVVVENPVRRKRLFQSTPLLFSAAAACTLALLAGGLYVRAKQGVPSRFDPQVVHYAAAKETPPFRREVSLADAAAGNFPAFGSATGERLCVVWGDSHAMALMVAIDDSCRRLGIRGAQATHSTTAPLLGFTSRGKFSMNEKCVEFNDSVARFALSQRNVTVILAAFWTYYDDDSAFEPCLKATLARLATGGVRVLLVRDVPVQAGDVPLVLSRAAVLHRAVESVGVPLGTHREKNHRVDQLFRRAAGPGVVVLDPAPCFVDDKSLCRAGINGDAMYWDSHHLSVAGARRLIPLFDSALAGRGRQ